MSDAAPAEAPNLDDAPASAPAAPVRPAGSSLAARASCFTFIFLLIVAVSTWVYLFWIRSEQVWPPKPDVWLRTGLVLFLLVVIPIVVYRTITLYMMRERAKYPDIHFAWEAGISALAQNGMSLSSAPITLVFGGLNPNSRRNFMHASGYQFRVDCVPDGPAPFHWYAHADGIYIVLNNASWVHEACHLAGQAKRAKPAAGGAPAAAPANMPAAAQTIRPGDLQLDQAAAAAPAPQEAPAAPAGLGDIRGTIDLSKFRTPAAAPVAQHAAPVGPRVDSETSTQLLSRLQHVCGLIRNARHPVCPINGVLALIPYEILQDSQQDVKELRRAFSGDLSVAQRELRLRCPVTAVVTGMEKERGFRELIKRVGPQRAARQRFGQRFDLGAEATIQELANFARHVCGTFEDWVYVMFGERDSLSHPGNNLLFAMLCRVRRSIRTRLSDVLEGFGARPDDDFWLIFSGCYFAATGVKGERQAFVRGVLDKLQDEQEEVEWTDEAIASDRRVHTYTLVGWAFTGLIVLGIAGYAFL